MRYVGDGLAGRKNSECSTETPIPLPPCLRAAPSTASMAAFRNTSGSPSARRLIINWPFSQSRSFACRRRKNRRFRVRRVKRLLERPKALRAQQVALVDHDGFGFFQLFPVNVKHLRGEGFAGLKPHDPQRADRVHQYTE